MRFVRVADYSVTTGSQMMVTRAFMMSS